MKVLDYGHKYKLFTLDGDTEVILTFVKRCDPPEKYPGNTTSYSGTTLQEVMRCLIDRLAYLDSQKYNPINNQIINLLRLSIWLLEVRAFEAKDKSLSTSTLNKPETIPIREVDAHFDLDLV